MGNPQAGLRYGVPADLLIRLRGYDLFTCDAIRSANLQVELGASGLLLVSAFASPCTLDQAFERVRGALDLKRTAFNDAIVHLIGAGLLFPVDGADDAPPPRGGFADPTVHLTMLQDAVRTDAYRRAIEALAPGRSVLDLGCGSGIMGMLALRAGARSVHAIEESAIIQVARELVDANGGGVHFHQGNSMHLELPERVDLIVHELIGVDPFAEDLLTSIADARERFLAPGGLLVPHRLEVCCIGVSWEEWEDPGPVLDGVAALEATLGLDLAPLGRAIGEHFSTIRHGACRNADHIRPSGTACTLYDLDLTTDVSELAATPRTVDMVREGEGPLNAIALFFRAHLGAGIVLSTAPWEPKTHWAWRLYELPRCLDLKVGERLTITATVRCMDGQDRICLALEETRSPGGRGPQ